MKRTIVLMGILILLSAVALQGQAPARKPGTEHKKLEIWVGDWTVEGET